jgi:transposase
MTTVTTIGIDLAKQIFHVHGVDQRGKTVLRRKVGRSDILTFFANLPRCLIGIEAGRASHHWARELSRLGHEVKLMPPQYVKPYVKTNKNDALDAEAICEAVRRPTMRFVPIKTVDQQAILSVHRAREQLVRTRTAQVNQLRGLLGEFGIVVRSGINCVIRAVESVIGDDVSRLPALLKPLLRELVEHVRLLDEKIARLERQIVTWHRDNEASRRLAAIPGVGPLTASAMVASVPDPNAFRSGRQLAAWLGLVPRQHSSGSRERILGISKRGNVYLRTLLIHGARSIATHTRSCPHHVRSWLEQLRGRRHANVAVVALANKMARIIWAVMVRNEPYVSTLARA